LTGDFLRQCGGRAQDNQGSDQENFHRWLHLGEACVYVRFVHSSAL
jgi:hypothetical protein